MLKAKTKVCVTLMNNDTISVYDREAERIAQLHSTLTPHRIYELIDKHFIQGGMTLDAGCGIGRDTHWLSQRGFSTVGVDASLGMLQQAAKLYPNERFIYDSLPELQQLTGLSFQNILCSAVLMHLSSADQCKSYGRLLSLLAATEACLILSFRGTHETTQCEHGKRYYPVACEQIFDSFNSNGFLIEFETVVEKKRGLTWQNAVIKRVD